MAEPGSWLTEALATFEGPLVRYTTRLLGDVDRARDVVQDCFLRLCRQQKSDVQDHLAEWLFAVCRNRALDLQRKKDMVTLDTDLASGTTGPGARLEQREQLKLVRGRLDGLPSRDQEVVRLKFQEGLSYKQISAVTDLSVSNVGFILHQALKRLRSELTPQGPEMEGPELEEKGTQQRKQA